MEPTISDGRLALFDVNSQSLVDGWIYVLRGPDGLRIKRVRLRMDGSVALVSDNKEKYDPEYLTREQAEHVHVLGRLFWAERAL